QSLPGLCSSSARCPAPGAQVAAAAALHPPPLEHRSPGRGVQNDPRAGSARRCSGEQATEALEAAVQGSARSPAPTSRCGSRTMYTEPSRQQAESKWRLPRSGFSAQNYNLEFEIF
ncbi:Hypothetical predicted protein, partial [Marmota monax]